MRVTSRGGDFVEIGLDGYQFEDGSAAPPGDWDANWLYVAGRARLGTTSWHFREPCLTTWEARALLAWLRALPDAAPTSIDFTEPNLSFRADPDAAGEIALTLTLAGEAAPPSRSEDERWAEGVPMAFRVPAATLAAAADEWETSLATHPPR